MNSHTLFSRLIILLTIILLCAQSSASQEYILVGWNDLGMHCSNKDFSKIAVLPPYNNVTAQLLFKQPGQQPRVVSAGITIEYSIPNNTYSVGKTDFWTYAQQLFGLTSPLPPNIGLTGKGLTGVLDSSGGYFIAHGIPVTPYADSDLVHEVPFQLIHLVAKKTSDGAILATTDVVIPVSNEVGCVQSGCHSSESAILNSHEAVAGFNRTGPVLCASCHASNALGTKGTAEAAPFSFRIHDRHSQVSGPPGSIATCYKCHPGPNTQCLRDIMGKNPTNPLVCQNCHGTLDTLAASIANGRRPWLDEPKCGHCHGSAYAEEPGKLYRQSTSHGGLYCSACHGSPHAIQPTVQGNDNLQNIRLQGFAGTLRKCSVCHADSPSGAGPHGIVDTTFALPAAPLLSVPANGVTNQQLLPFLGWKTSFSAEYYRVEVAIDTGFTFPIIDDTTVADTERYVGPLSLGTTYFWRVKAKNHNGWSGWSSRWSFTTATLPSAPITAWPSDSASGTPTILCFKWHEVANSDYYTIQVGLDSTFSSGLALHGPSTDTCEYAFGLFPNTRYFWRVRAVGIAGHGAWSATSRLTTGDTTYESRINVMAGWNLLSVPLAVPDGGKNAIYPAAVTKAYAFERVYLMMDTLHCGIGYWLKFRNDTSISVYGQLTTSVTVDVRAGWNMIGSVATGVWVGNIVSEPPGLVTSNFWNYSGVYKVADTLQPGRGYWVKINAPGKLILASGPITSAAARISIALPTELPPAPPEEFSTRLDPRPSAYILEQNYPNPFNPTTTFKYALPSDCQTRLTVINVLGQTIATLVAGVERAGYKTVGWNATTLPSGLYFYHLEARSLSDPNDVFSQVRKMLLVK